MKSILFAVPFLTVLINVAHAGSSDVANVNVNLNDYKSIVIKSDQKAVNINISSSDDYVNVAGSEGVSAFEPGHLTVISTTGGFKVKIATSGNLVNTANGSATLPMGNIYIKASNPTQVNGGSTPSGLNGSAFNGGDGVNLNAGGTTGDIIFSNSQQGGTLGTTFDMNYKLKNISNIAQMPAGTYSATVTYTIESN